MRQLIPILTLLGICSPAHAFPQRTASSNELAISVSGYRYEEPNFMSLQGLKNGLDLRFTQAQLAQPTFIREEFRFAAGTVDYQSKDTGSHNSEPDWYFEGRILTGSDWFLGNAVISTYTGLGYRFLLNDGRGLSTTNAAGYRRESNYLYLPLGILYRIESTDVAQWTGVVEYDHLLAGNQFTRLSDAGLGYADLNSKQDKGYGVKLRLTYSTTDWFFGPYLHYWDIADSRIDVIYKNGLPAGYGVEPKNRTTEFGFEFGRPF